MIANSQAKAPAAQKRSPAWVSFMRKYGIIIVIILLVLFNIYRIWNTISTTESFIAAGTVRQQFVSYLIQAFNVNLTQVATIVIVATGMTLVIATGGIDLSVGATMAIAGQIAPLIFMGTIGQRLGLGWANALAFTVPVVAAALVGLINGTMVSRLKFQPIIATLVVFIGGRGIAQVLTNGYLQYFKNTGFQYIALGRPLGIPTQVYIMFAVVIIASLLMSRTAFGRYVLATGGNEKAARLAGVPVDRIKTSVYVISGLLAGIAGLIVVAINSASDANLNGRNMELDAIAAAAVGGTSLAGGQATITGTLLGALVIQLMRFTLISIGVPYEFALVVNAALILSAVYVQMRRA